MLKTLKNVISQDRENFRIPKSVQDVIPVKKIYEDGVFLLSNGRYSVTYKFTDINYAVASKEDKESMFLNYAALLNSFDTGATTKLTIVNRRLNKTDFENDIRLEYMGDGLDRYRAEYNAMLMSKVTGADSMVRDLYLTVSVHKKTISEARTYFIRSQAEISSHLARLGSKLTELSGVEKLQLLHSFYRPGEEALFRFDFRETARKGHSFKDFICPDTFEFEKDFFRMGDQFGRVLYLREYASYIKDNFCLSSLLLTANISTSPIT